MRFVFFIYNVLGFKACWWACVLGAVNGQKYLGPVLVLLYLAIHIYYLPQESRPSEINLLLFAAIFGTLADSLLLNLGLLIYKGTTFSFLAPFWITAMWVGFTATLNHSFKGLDGKFFIQLILGLVFGPISYLTGKSFGAINFSSQYPESTILIVIALTWGISFPLLYAASKKIKN